MASYRNQNKDNGEMKKITDEIKNCNMLKDIGIKKFVNKPIKEILCSYS